jgi:hypothetical protein
MRRALAVSGSSPTVFNPIALKIGCAQSRASAGPDASKQADPAWPVSPGADHGTIHEHDPVVLSVDPATRFTPLPTVLVWSQTAPSATDSAACHRTALCGHDQARRHDPDPTPRHPIVTAKGHSAAVPGSASALSPQLGPRLSPGWDCIPAPICTCRGAVQPSALRRPPSGQAIAGGPADVLLGLSCIS